MGCAVPPNRPPLVGPPGNGITGAIIMGIRWRDIRVDDEMSPLPKAGPLSHATVLGWFSIACLIFTEGWVSATFRYVFCIVHRESVNEKGDSDRRVILTLIHWLAPRYLYSDNIKSK